MTGLPTPHSGFHWDGSDRRFFEGWYLRLTLPTLQESVAFMYSIEDPLGGQPQSGGTAQILGFGDTYYCRSFPDVEQFWAWRHRLGFGHWRSTQTPTLPRYLSPALFERTVTEGYQVTDRWHQGCLRNPATGKSIRWSYAIEPWDGWGDRSSLPQATAGWLSFLPIFEPGWQVLMAHGRATGWMDWEGQHYEFADVPAYAEKNWGGAFPEQWFWMQCNGFEAAPDLSLTAVGSWRQVLGLREQVGLVGLHHQGKFYEFAPWNARIAWAVAPWGEWQMVAEQDADPRRGLPHLRVELLGTCDRPPTSVRVPTEDGMVFACQDTTHGTLTVTLWSDRQRLLQATSHQAGLEVGGRPWTTPWRLGDLSRSPHRLDL